MVQLQTAENNSLIFIVQNRKKKYSKLFNSFEISKNIISICSE